MFVVTGGGVALTPEHPVSTPNFNLFVYDDLLFETVNSGTDMEQEVLYTGPWPLTAWFMAYNHQDGRGWGRDVFERYGRVVKYHVHDVASSGSEAVAVLVEVANLSNFLALDQCFTLCDAEPIEL